MESLMRKHAELYIGRRKSGLVQFATQLEEDDIKVYKKHPSDDDYTEYNWDPASGFMDGEFINIDDSKLALALLKGTGVRKGQAKKVKDVLIEVSLPKNSIGKFSHDGDINLYIARVGSDELGCDDMVQHILDLGMDEGDSVHFKKLKIVV